MTGEAADRGPAARDDVGRARGVTDDGRDAAAVTVAAEAGPARPAAPGPALTLPAVPDAAPAACNPVACQPADPQPAVASSVSGQPPTSDAAASHSASWRAAALRQAPGDRVTSPAIGDPSFAVSASAQRLLAGGRDRPGADVSGLPGGAAQPTEPGLDAAIRSVTLPIGPSPSADAGRGLLRVPPADLARLGLRPGDTVALEAGRRTHARVLPLGGENGRFGACATLTANAGAMWGVTACATPVSLPPLATATLDLVAGDLPTPETIALALRDMILSEGDAVEVFDGPGAPLRLKVTLLDPSPAGHVTDVTVFTRARAADIVPRYGGIGGLAAQIAAIHELVETPLLRPDLFARLGVPPPRGVLFVGPPGTGKTLLARAVAERTSAAFFHVGGPELISKHYGESEGALRKLFETAARAAPAIVFIDEIDAIAPRRDGLSGEKQVERRVVAQLLTLLDGLGDRGRVVVLAATNMPDSLDPALRRPGRFDREIVFQSPDTAAREEILRVHLARAPLAADADLATIAALSHGYVGADLAALASEAAMAALARAVMAAGGVDYVRAETLAIEQRDLQSGLARTRPSTLRDGGAPQQTLRWGDIGGLDAAKAALTEAVLWPMAHLETVRRLHLTLPKGILLAGPPGSGKTMLVRALAAESGMNFIAVPPARLLSQFLGEAERAIADLFARARQASPCLLFFDEIDAIAPRRGNGDATLDRIVGQLLLEMDGLQENRGIVVIGATNRAADIDRALTRPGRFDLVIPIGLPGPEARREVLAVHSRGRPMAPDVDLAVIAIQTEGWSSAALALLMAAAARRALARALGQGAAGLATVQIGRDDVAAALADVETSDATRHG